PHATFRSFERTRAMVTSVKTPSQHPPARERILRATLEVVAADGTAAITNRRVAAAAAVSLGSLTYHFPDQRDLLRESLAFYIRGEVERIESLARRMREQSLAPEEIGLEIQRLA